MERHRPAVDPSRLLLRTLEPRASATLGKPGGPAASLEQKAWRRDRQLAAGESGLPACWGHRSELAWGRHMGAAVLAGIACSGLPEGRTACLGPLGSLDGKDTAGQNRGESDATATRIFSTSGMQRRHVFIVAGRSGKSTRGGGASRRRWPGCQGLWLARRDSCAR
ncbi:hypothetical protein B0J12DRAFT_640422 [Macrophomina phaseolina]|uniref:Uncharacterized protein n=1 Tax=Macrophomina phaseolina TaxID=35725 RepID=A0ABQ8GYZ7_9PEZI|nr:hypothetical protein B0J12DRAFT_640422 [Macrophomina phaseolina]